MEALRVDLSDIHNSTETYFCSNLFVEFLSLS